LTLHNCSAILYLIKHGVSSKEAESTFFDSQKKIVSDDKHSTPGERRFVLFGKSLEGRVLMVGFTVRNEKVRIITARPASRRERAFYET
jgi:uncharacterized DUF497 family protein